MLRQFFLRERQNLDCLLSFIAQNWEAMAKTKAPMAITITDTKAKRSSQANRYYWAVLNQISEDAWMDGRQYSADVFHEYFKRQFIGVIDLPGGHSMAESTTKLDTAEFAAYVRKIEFFAAQELGVQLVDMSTPSGRVA